MSLLGRAAWWLPRWLDRALPNVDIEGEQLREHLDGEASSVAVHNLPVSCRPGGVVPPGRKALDHHVRQAAGSRLQDRLA